MSLHRRESVNVDDKYEQRVRFSFGNATFGGAL
jgi:hypothetical protein